MTNTTADIEWRYFFVWITVLLPVFSLTTSWILIHWFLLLAAGPSLAWHAWRKDNGRSWPFTTAFILSLLIPILGQEYFIEIGLENILPGILEQ